MVVKNGNESHGRKYKQSEHKYFLQVLLTLLVLGEFDPITIFSVAAACNTYICVVSLLFTKAVLVIFDSKTFNSMALCQCFSKLNILGR